MDISGIYVHDGKLLRVVEDAEQEKIKMAVSLPADPMSDKLVPRLLVFEDVYGYQIFEGRVSGCPVILDLSVVEQSGRWSEFALTRIMAIENYIAQQLDFVSLMTMWPNTALEPTADPRLGLSGSVGFATRQFGGGSAFVR